MWEKWAVFHITQRVQLTNISLFIGIGNRKTNHSHISNSVVVVNSTVGIVRSATE